MTRIPPEEPERWTERGEGSTLDDRLGVALRAAAEASLARVPTFDPRATAAAGAFSAEPKRRRWWLPALAAVTVTLGGAVSAAQAVRAARRAAFTRVEVPRGSTVALANRRHRKLNLVGPIAISGDVDRIAISGEGEAHIEAGEQPLEILPATGGSIIQLAPGTSWPPMALGHEPAQAGPAAVAVAPARQTESIAPPATSQPRPVRAAAERPTRALAPVARRLAMLEPPAFAPPASASRAPASDGRPDRAGDEAALVATMFRALHAEHDPARALALAEGHARAFPDGELTVEATAARVEALLALGRRSQALEILDGVSDDAAATSPARTLLRGELRLAGGRCALALRDFVVVESAKSGGGANDLGSRAFLGHGTCSARLGDLAGARASFARYLEISPTGPAAGEARRFLSEHPSAASDGTFRPPATLGQSKKESK
jgi:hypothetical protein